MKFKRSQGGFIPGVPKGFAGHDDFVFALGQGYRVQPFFNREARRQPFGDAETLRSRKARSTAFQNVLCHVLPLKILLIFLGTKRISGDRAPFPTSMHPRTTNKACYSVSAFSISSFVWKHREPIAVFFYVRTSLIRLQAKSYAMLRPDTML
jgi:hypothetical protein